MLIRALAVGPPSRQNGSLSHAIEHVASGKLDEALAALEGRDDASARLLAARISLRMSQPTRALVILRGLRDATRDQRCLATVFRTVAESRCDSVYREVVVPEGASDDVVALAHYFRGSTQWQHGKFKEAARSARLASQAPDPANRMLGLHLLAWIDVKNSRFADAFSHFELALEALDEAEAGDEMLRTTIVHGLVSTAVETLDVASFPRVLEAVEGLRPSAWSAKRASQAFSYASLARELSGDSAGAYELLLRAREVAAAETPTRAAADVDLGSFFLRHGARAAAGLHFQIAKKVLFAANWANADADEQLVLIVYAIASAEIHRASASKALTLALSRTGRRDTALVFEHDQRAAITAEFAKGRVLMTRDPERSLDIYQDCMTRWELLGYKLRAAEAALELLRAGEIEGAPSLRQAIRLAPNAWFKAELKAAKKRLRSPLTMLTNAERRVVDGICEGLTSRQIAERLDRSPSTVRNQTIAVYRRLGVGTRSSLVALVKDAAAER